MKLNPHHFTKAENHTWARLFERQKTPSSTLIYPLFSEGLTKLEIDSDRVPDLDQINKRLYRLTGFKGVLVVGHEAPASFFPMLSRREFPIGNFIRDAEDISYTPAPDIFHDLYGHLPFLANPDYADFSEKFGRIAMKYEHDEKIRLQFERLYWFTFEFGLIKTPHGNQIFGAGLASSSAEIDYALSDRPEVLPFDLEIIRKQDFKIDEFQKRLFLLENTKQLYSCLEAFEAGIQ